MKIYKQKERDWYTPLLFEADYGPLPHPYIFITLLSLHYYLFFKPSLSLFVLSHTHPPDE